MRIAVIADIHGNLPALEAVIADIRCREVDCTINLGDCVSGPLWPREVCDLVMARDDLTIRGNHDRWVSGALTLHAWVHRIGMPTRNSTRIIAPGLEPCRPRPIWIAAFLPATAHHQATFGISSRKCPVSGSCEQLWPRSVNG